VNVDTQTALDALDPRMRDTLASLAGVDKGIVQAVIQLVPFDERPPLIKMGIIRNGLSLGQGHHSAEITNFGWAVINAAGE
jgi:hypothetical protein